MNWDKFIDELDTNKLDSDVEKLHEPIVSNPEEKHSPDLQQNIIKNEPKQKKAKLGYNPGWEKLQNLFQSGGNFEGKKLEPFATRYLQPKADEYYKKFLDLKNKYDALSTDEPTNKYNFDPKEEAEFWKNRLKDIAKEKQVAISNEDEEGYKALNREEEEAKEFLKSYMGLYNQAQNEIKNKSDEHNSLTNQLRDLYNDFKQLKHTQTDTERFHDVNRVIARDFKNDLDYLDHELSKYENDPKYSEEDLNNNEIYQGLKKNYDELSKKVTDLYINGSSEQVKPALDKYGYKPADYSFNDYDFENLFKDEWKGFNNGKNN